MKQLQKSDLIEGEIYKLLSHTINYIFIFKGFSDTKGVNGDRIMCSYYITPNYSYHNLNKEFDDTFADFRNNIVDATPKEKHWLKECIKNGTFISYEEAMKTFVSEFTLPEKWYIKVRLLNNDQLQKLVDHLRLINKDNNTYSLNSVKNWYPFIGSVKGSHYLTDPYFISDSYQEITFDQFEKYVLKEESVTIKATVETKSKFIDSNTVETSEGSIFKVGDKVTIYNSDNKTIFKILSFRWKNDQSEICAVVPNLPNGIGVDKLEIYLKPKKVVVTSNDNESLLDKAKRLYPIGTKIKSVLSDSSFYGKIINHNFFEYTTSIGIETDIYWVTVYCDNKWAEVIEYPHGFKVGDKIKLSRWQHSSLMKDIEYVIIKIEGNQLFLNDNNSVLAKNAIKIDDFVLPEKWCVKVTNKNVDFINKVRDRRCYNTYMTSRLILTDIKNSWWCCLNAPFQGYTEITFGQFKKYVLNETV